MAIRRQKNRTQRVKSLEPYNSATSNKKKKNNNHNDVIYLEQPRLYVNNLSWDVAWQDLKDLFRQVCIT